MTIGRLAFYQAAPWSHDHAMQRLALATRKALYLRAYKPMLPAKPYICWLFGFRLLAGGQKLLAWGGRAEPNGPMAAERLLKLFIFFIKNLC